MLFGKKYHNWRIGGYFPWISTSSRKELLYALHATDNGVKFCPCAALGSYADLKFYNTHLKTALFKGYNISIQCISSFNFDSQEMKNCLKKEIEKMTTTWVDSKISKLIH